MAHALTLPAARPASPPARRIGTLVGLVLAAWLAFVFVMGWNGAYMSPAGAPPLPVMASALLPVALFLAAYALSRPFRDFVLAADLRLLTAVQAWRFAGFGFLALYVHGILPARFAWPAGLGDIAIGVTAPLIVLALVRRPGFAASRTFVTWNVLGMLDLVSAMGSGALSVINALPGEVSTGPMSQLPLILLPAYLVPIFLMLHIAALAQARRAAAQRRAAA